MFSCSVVFCTFHDVLLQLSLATALLLSMMVRWQHPISGAGVYCHCMPMATMQRRFWMQSQHFEPSRAGSRQLVITELVGSVTSIACGSCTQVTPVRLPETQVLFAAQACKTLFLSVQACRWWLSSNSAKKLMSICLGLFCGKCCHGKYLGKASLAPRCS